MKRDKNKKLSLNNKNKKLSLNKDTIRELQKGVAEDVAGGDVAIEYTGGSARCTC